MNTGRKEMMKTILTVLAVAAVLFGIGSAAGSSVAFADDVQITGQLAGQPAVRRMRVYREGRFELQPFVGFTLQDEYSRTILFGLQAQYHVTDWLGFGLWGGYAPIGIDTALTEEVVAEGQTTTRNVLSLPSNQYFDEQIGRIQWVGALQASFIPLRGKLALFQKLFVDADFGLFAGGALVGVEERADVDNEDDDGPCQEVPSENADTDHPCIATQFERTSRLAFAPTFGVNLSLFVNNFMALNFEWRALPFSWNTSGTDESGSPDGDFPDKQIDSDDRIFHFNHMVVIGWSFMLPTEAKLTD